MEKLLFSKFNRMLTDSDESLYRVEKVSVKVGLTKEASYRTEKVNFIDKN
jgi:hypothetical protein